MKSLLFIMSMTVIFAAWAGDKPVNKTESITGTVMEIKDVDSYTYLRIKTVTGDDLTGFFCARLNVGFFNLEEGVTRWRTRSVAPSRRS